MKLNTIWFSYYTFIASTLVCVFAHVYVVVKEWQYHYVTNQGQTTVIWELAVNCKELAYGLPIISLLACLHLNRVRQYAITRFLCAVALLASCIWAMLCVIAAEIQALPQIDLKSLQIYHDHVSGLVSF
jgi:hypothetical protein